MQEDLVQPAFHQSLFPAQSSAEPQFSLTAASAWHATLTSEENKVHF
ncbi:hypothetical protein [Ktedonobacter sp. SOSP1-85]|nr:hypothetical protein [Ktedonobacter sp. SOSP1-85]